MCIIVSIILIVLSINNNSRLNILKLNTISFCKPVFAFIGKPFNFLNDTFTFFSDLKNAKLINKSLLDENRILKKQVNKNNFLLLENYRLKNLLKITDVNYARKITARVIIDPYRGDSSVIYIDVGKKDSVKINDIVFNEKGLIGRVIELGNYSSKVLTIFNQNSVIPVVSVKTKKSFFVKGNKNFLNLKHIENKFDLEHGETIVTTDAAGYFKENINIGRVVKTLNEVFIYPFAKKSDSIYVNVLIFEFKKEFKD